MKINVAKSAGFCFGVKRAIEIALNTVQSNQKVEILGDIVHNEDVVREVERAGITKVNQLSNGKGKILLIRAHGAPAKTYKRAKSLGYEIVDASCPMVKEIYEIAERMENEGCQVIIIGDKEHDEVKGIVGHLNREAIVIDSEKNIPLHEIKAIRKACVVVQSTQNLEKVLRIVDILKQNINDLIFYNTICKPTRTKQKEIKTMPRENDVMVIIGSKTSANTRRLYEISKSLNQRTFWVESEKDVKSQWFKDAKTVGITSGASTPEETTKKVIEHIRKIT